jgi:starch synthase
MPAPLETRSAAGAPLDILMVTPEARPFAKTGGLADVAGALPPALARLGHRVTLVVPRYRGIDIAGTDRETASVPFGPNRYPVTFVERRISDGITAVLIDAPDLYDRDGLYGTGNVDYADNAFRFAVLSRGALEYARLRRRRPSVVHAHDWQAALAPVYLQTVLASDEVLGGVPSVLTIHNLAFQGLFPPDVLQGIGLTPDLFRVDSLEFWGRVSYLKGGIVYSRAITTVSPTYAREILTPEFGFGFEGILRARANDLVGILNGIDTDAWNPATDPYLPTHFTEDSLDAKADVKRALLEDVRLPTDAEALARPTIGLVSRLTDQKGFDLIAAASDRLLALDAAWVLLGSGDPRYEVFWRAVQARHPGRVAVHIGFHERLAHLIEGGADLFLMASRFEPCGLNQMYSLRYGTIPVVRAVGGLDDTVQDADEVPRGGTGFKFREYSAEALVEAVGRALEAYREPRRWKALQRRAMRQDHSWDVSAREYVKVYRGIETGKETDGIRKDTDADRRQLRTGNQRRTSRAR